MPAMSTQEAREHVKACFERRHPWMRNPTSQDREHRLPPHMWIVARIPDNAIVAARPAKVTTERSGQAEEVDGVAYQLFRHGRWIDDEQKGTWDDFAKWAGDQDSWLIPTCIMRAD